MMVYIIVEGITDKALVRKLLSDLGKIEKTDYQFLGLKGIESVRNTLENLTEKDLSQNRYFAIVDADRSFRDRKNDMETWTQERVDFFIFPNNDDDGDLETLLLSHIDSSNKIIRCFDAYKECVGKEINNKAKLYAYTTLEHDKRPEEYIETLDMPESFTALTTKLQNLFEGI